MFYQQLSHIPATTNYLLMFTSVLSTNAYKSGHYKQFIDVCWSFTNESCHYNHFIDVYWCFLMFAYHLLIKAVTTNTLLMFIDVSLPFVNKSGHYKQFIDVTWWFTNKSDHYNQFTMFLDDLLMKPLTYLSFALWPAPRLDVINVFCWCLSTFTNKSGHYKPFIDDCLSFTYDLP